MRLWMAITSSNESAPSPFVSAMANMTFTMWTPPAIPRFIPLMWPIIPPIPPIVPGWPGCTLWLGVPIGAAGVVGAGVVWALALKAPAPPARTVARAVMRTNAVQVIDASLQPGLRQSTPWMSAEAQDAAMHRSQYDDGSGRAYLPNTSSGSVQKHHFAVPKKTKNTEGAK